MGILALEPHPRLAAPDSPPELVSPTSSSYSSRPSPPGDTRWTLTAPVSPPMSNYEHNSAADVSTVGNSMEDSQSRKDPATSAPRQQLPSLSSLFGPPASVRPLRSPLSDRPSSYSATSPLDRPRVSSAHGDRSYPTSYFSQATSPSITQPRSTYDGKFDLERPPVHALARSFSGPGSPRYREPENLRHEPRSDAGLGSKWSAHQESGRHEYSLSSRNSSGSLRSPHDRLPFQFSGLKDPGLSYRDQRPAPGPGLNQPPTPTSTVASEGIPSKDGLGPKIWTGTHFLPRFVRAAEVPGEGMCYFYDDGSHCKTVIDGEAVNAHWGVTKAGKPRKRLAIACITCREKKIKCDPDYPRCVQCEKFGRICKFKNAPRGGHNTSPSTPPAELDEMRRLGGPSKPNDLRRPGSNSSSSVSPRTTMRQPSPEPPMPHKRMRLGYENYPPMIGEPSSMVHTPETAKSSLSWHHHHQAVELPRIHEDVLNRAWQTDPYVSDPQSISTVISSFFVHIDSTMALRFLPEKPFKSWVAGNAHRKSPEDLMLVYSILAVGVTLSGGPKNIAYEYAQVARFAQQRAAYGLQLVQTRLLLAIYYISISRPCESNDMSSAALSAAACMQLNLEVDKSIDSGMVIFPYGLNRAGYAETRRRTFWACFVSERLGGMFPGRPSILNTGDIFLRLPSDPQSFEDQVDAQSPFFGSQPTAIPKLAEQPAGTLSHFVQVVDIWAEVMASIYRNTHRLSVAGFDFLKFLHTTLARLDEWQSTLPRRLTYHPGNMDQAALDGTLGSFLTMHLLYHHTMIKLHRHIHPSQQLSAPARIQYLFKIQDHAMRILDITGALDLILTARRTRLSTPPPTMSYAILEAVDVLTAEGPVADISVLLDRLTVAKHVVEVTGTVWEEAKVHRLAMEHRLDKLFRVRERGSEASSPVAGLRVFVNREESKENRLPAGLCWQLTEPLETIFPKNMDLVYTSLTQLPLYA